MSNFIFAWAKIFDHFQGLLKMGYGCKEILHANIFACFLSNCNFYFQVPQNWGAGELDFGEGVEFGTIEIVLDNQLVKSQSVNVNIAISDDNRTLCEGNIQVVDDICKF